jgi:hypothetical protein
MYIGLHIKYPLFFSDLEFSRMIFKKYSNFTKICPVATELLPADGREDKNDKTKSLFVILRTRLTTAS